ncbi:hypothetical protein [Clavibacter michiganensis]|uniref:hypothetical protein n=1 Tax=Clavibacter michiganensis TaxID=28447 RepID=UPI00119822A1|nr:hypothetical protein [Clavibacter michiganensis]
MDEKDKDKLETSAAIVAQTFLSIFPIFGGPVSTVFGHVIAHAQQVRTEKMLGDIVSDLQRLAGQVDEGAGVNKVLASDQFVANVTLTIRHMQETADATRIAYLRHALVAGVKKKWRSKSEPLLHRAIRMTTMHIVVLESIVELAGHNARSVQGGTVAVRDKLATMHKKRSEAHVSHLCDELAAEGLLIAGKPRTGPAAEGRSVRLTYQGLDFYNYLRDGV